MYTLVTHEGGQVMYVSIPYILFMQAMVSWLINCENIPYVCKPCCLLHCTVLWARVTERFYSDFNTVCLLCLFCCLLLV